MHVGSMPVNSTLMLPGIMLVISNGGLVGVTVGEGVGDGVGVLVGVGVAPGRNGVI